MRTLIFLVISISFSYSQAECLARHIREAIELNTERKPLYSHITDSKSQKISRKLILREKIALRASWLLIDRDAKFYNDNGIPIICNDLVEMSETPPFSPKGPTLDPKTYKKYSAHKIKTRFKKLLRSRDFFGLHKAASKEISKLPAGYNCMVRHILESIARSALLAPEYQKTALAQGLPDPLFLSVRFIRLTIDQLDYASDLDHLAMPMQTQGIPIICQDVPPIPYLSVHFQ